MPAVIAGQAGAGIIIGDIGVKVRIFVAADDSGDGSILVGRDANVTGHVVLGAIDIVGTWRIWLTTDANGIGDVGKVTIIVNVVVALLLLT